MNADASVASGLPLDQQLQLFRDDFDSLRKEMGRVIVGQREVIESVLTALVCGGHVLLEGVPGIGKTLLGKTLAETVNVRFRRIQFTPDSMPADVVGTYIVMESHGRRSFEFQQGPIFASILLADEINRATPKTQSAMLEGLGEGAVTVANERYELPAPFFCIATQSQNDVEGTFPLPQTEMDRFFFKLQVPFPNNDEVATILDRTTEGTVPTAKKVMDGKRIREMTRVVRQVENTPEIKAYAISLLMATHPNRPEATPMVRQYVQQGSSPRGAQAMILGAKVRAILDGRSRVTKEDVRQVALSALRHRVTLNFEGQAEQVDADSVLQEVLGK